MKENGLLLEVKNLSKGFAGVQALKDVKFKLYGGTVHALLGENGAGKSTLIKILSGVYKADEGQITLNGKPVKIHNPREAHHKGIFTVHQELSLAPHLSVAENVFLGLPKPTKKGGFIDWKKLYRLTTATLDKLGLKIDPDQHAGSLKVGEQQLVEIAKGFVTEPKILIMDEPTSALSMYEIEFMFKTIEKIKAQGIGIIYISHRMEEIFEIADSATILRDGTYVDTCEVCDLTLNAITQMMTGKDTSMVDRETFRQNAQVGKELLRVNGLKAEGVNDVSFALKKGEIIGLAGLMGSGRSEIAKAIFGANTLQAGSIFLEGKEVEIRSPHDALKLGIGYTTEDRKNEGALLEQSVKTNLTISILRQLSTGGWLGKSENKKANDIVSKYNVKTPNLKQEIKYLSGGNQQKVIIARILAANLKVIILDEPTKGIDVASKYEICMLVNDLANLGLAVIFISSELSEVIDVADRILMIKDGKIISILSRQLASKETVIKELIKENEQ
jgi:ABC-type sugar transport system ATPase subunit